MCIFHADSGSERGPGISPGEPVLQAVLLDCLDISSGDISSGDQPEKNMESPADIRAGRAFLNQARSVAVSSNCLVNSS